MKAMVVGTSHYGGGEFAEAVTAFEQAYTLNPNSEDALLNLANAHRALDESRKATAYANRVLELDPGSAAAWYIIGCAHLRQGNPEEALKALQTSERLEPNSSDEAELNALTYQIGRAHFGLQQWDDAIDRFYELIRFDPQHPSAYFNLSQALLRAGREDEAAEMAEEHQQLLASNPDLKNDLNSLEACAHTKPRVPFKLAEPDAAGIPVTFADRTAEAFGGSAASFGGPIALLDINHRGANDLFVMESGNAFRLLMNSNGVFSPQGESIAAQEGNTFERAVVGDVQNDDYEDVIMLGSTGVQYFKFATNGVFVDQTIFAGMKEIKGANGLLADMNSDANLDLLAVRPDGTGMQLFENLGPPYFIDKTATSGVPASITHATSLAVGDWDGDDLMDLVVASSNNIPQLFIKQRGGPLVASDSPEKWTAGNLVALGDMNNNLRPDLVIAGTASIDVHFSRLPESVSIPLDGFTPRDMSLADFDNDGWVDIIAYGEGVRVWRNEGQTGFQDVTERLGLGDVTGTVEHIAIADFDNDCDPDIVASISGQGLRFLSNEGGNANRMLKLRLIGNRSNRSGLGVKILATAGNWRTSFTVDQLPIEVGVGAQDSIDSLDIRWFDASAPKTQLDLTDCERWTITEITTPTGSCPYLYRWDGEKFTFITDLLGTAPLGLPVSQSRYIDADTTEYVRIGNEAEFKPRGGYYELQVTEELREVLYLDEAKLVVVDHEPDVEVFSTSKLVPGKPFPAHTLVALRNEHRLIAATNHEGDHVADALRRIDQHMVSPTKLRAPQLRGLAEPHAVELEFENMDTEAPLFLVCNGWLRFGGGMANIGGSLNPELPFPFPILEASDASGNWHQVDVTVGSPAGKTKTIVTDLTGKLPAGATRLRLSTAFEIHWDSIRLMERAPDDAFAIQVLAPDETDLHWRGFSEFQDLPWDQPVSPDYAQVKQSPDWTITPEGWCTRYGPVDELIAATDNALVLLNGGDELNMKFAETSIVARTEGRAREFFFFNVGWDKDSDFHVKHGQTVGPLPWHGMDDQRYGDEARPAFENDDWMERYNTRWVGQRSFVRR